MDQTGQRQRSPLRAGLLLASVSRRAGGLFDAVRRLSQSLHGLGAGVEVFGVADGDAEADAPAWLPVVPQVFEPSRLPWLRHAPRLLGALASARLELLHVHGLWLYPSLASWRLSRRTGRPCLISPHGMLDPWALRQSRWKKRLAGWLYETPHLRQAACLHALCAAEARAFRAYGLRNPICIVPNGVDVPAPGPGGPPPWAGHWGGECPVLLFLGRLHPKKGLPNLLEAWRRLRQTDRPTAWRLAILGPDQQGHAAELDRLILAAGLQQEVHLFGPAWGAARDAALRAAAAFVLPSFSEGLPLAVLEAWAYGLPVLMTPACNLPEGFAAGAALSADPTPDSLAAGLADLFRLPEAARREMGMCGRRLVERDFSWPTVAAQLLEVYRWSLGGGPRPACVWAG
jgi:glycosyltransferase involved in cell wall biosynthesis